jgi:hypothetical protein
MNNSHAKPRESTGLRFAQSALALVALIALFFGHRIPAEQPTCTTNQPASAPEKPVSLAAT